MNPSKKFFYINENNCHVWVQNNYLSPAEAKNLNTHCQEKIPWGQHPIKLFGKEILQPRLTCSLGKEYKYSNKVHPVSEWTEPTKKLMEKLNKDLGTSFNACLLNRYRDGRDYMGAHADDEKSLSNGIVAGVSLGEERTMVMSEKNGKRRIKFPLTEGSLFVMEGDTQAHWKHGIPKELKKKKERISLTFRQFKE